MAPGGVKQVIDGLLAQGDVLTTGEVAQVAGVSRQAAQKQLKALVAAGRLTVEGKARAAKYRRAPGVVDAVQIATAAVDGSTGGDALPAFTLAAVDDSAPGLRSLAPLLTSAPLTSVDDLLRDGRVRVEVKSAGAEYRLQARVMLCDVTALELVVDFAGVEDVTDEFLDELLVRYAEAHPEVRFEIVNAAQAIRAAVARYWAVPAADRISLRG